MENNRDQFAEIALGEGVGETVGCSEVEPIQFQPKYFLPSNETAIKVETPSYEEQVKKFDQELIKLRKRYQPFLENYVEDKKLNRTFFELNNFQFRYSQEKDMNISRVLNGDGEWEEVTIPDFRGPTKENGKWTGYYRKEFTYDTKETKKRNFIVFKGVDYKANIYLNDRYIGSHEGFFAPFEFDVTNILQEENVLVVEVQNDYPTLGVNGKKLDGDKIYAATGLGWDDPVEGWHHCPPGGGIYNKVLLEERANLHIQDVFVRPNIDKDSVEVWIDVFNTNNELIEDFHISLDIFTRNFRGKTMRDMRFDIEYAGPGLNYYRYTIPMDSYRLWESTSPYLYTVRASIYLGDQILDIQDRSFGMKKFHQDEKSIPKGTFYFNNEPIILRGANEMGHLQRCVMEDDYDQLIDDILIAKMANMNFFRITQRPVQKEIYDYLDMLGMMHQTDLPLFSFLRRNQFSEAVRQSAEMERLIRSHPSSIIVSLMNEASMANKPNKRSKGHRHLFRDELERFFVAARQAIYIENPDRVIKNIEGDFEPPTKTGMPDFHCYNMWYTNNTIPISKMYKGYIPEIKNDWKTGCGEYGAEGLDNYDVMMRYYPKEWLPSNDEEEWFPDKIIASQTHSMHGDWYEQQSNIHDWIKESQRHQALAAKLMTDSLRRRSDIVISTAIHLLIDAWPSGWMKALVDVDRVPKQGYFEFQKSLEPLRINLRCDQWRGYAGGKVDVESWILNDTPRDYKDCEVRVTMRDDQTEYESFAITATSTGTMPSYAGSIECTLPQVEQRQKVYLDASLLDQNGDILNTESFTIEVFPKLITNTASTVQTIGHQAKLLCSALGVHDESYQSKEKCETILVADQQRFIQDKEEIELRVKNGATIIFLNDESNSFDYEIAGQTYRSKSMQELYFLAIDRNNETCKDLKAEDLTWLYNEKTDQLDFTANSYIDEENLQPLVFSYQQPAFNTQVRGEKRKRTVIGSTRIGKGTAFFINLPLTGKVGVNPTLDKLLFHLITNH